jgi:hypothetical protein
MVRITPTSSRLHPTKTPPLPCIPTPHPNPSLQTG